MLVVVERDALPIEAIKRQVVIDETRRCFQVRLDGVVVPASAVCPGNGLEEIRRAALLLLVAEMAGGTEGVLGLVVEYLNTRKQFDRYIGSYQALKHPMVDMLIGLEQARSHLYHAATVIDTDEADTALAMAKAAAGDAFAFAGDRAVQFHGAFGFTYECDAQLYLRRALWCQYQFGDARHHRKRLAEALL